MLPGKPANRQKRFQAADLGGALLLLLLLLGRRRLALLPGLVRHPLPLCTLRRGRLLLLLRSGSQRMVAQHQSLHAALHSQSNI